MVIIKVDEERRKRERKKEYAHKNVFFVFLIAILTLAVTTKNHNVYCRFTVEGEGDSRRKIETSSTPKIYRSIVQVL
jgi:hypothetical protein